MSRAPERPAAVLFDLDGTLADTFADLMPALDAALQVHRLPAGERDAVREAITGGVQAMVAAALGPDPAPELTAAVSEEFLHRYQHAEVRHTALFPGMHQVLDRLEQRAIAWGVVTNKLARFTDPVIDGLGIRGRLAALVSGDSAARGKPHPDPLLLAARTLGQPPHRCLYVGDARNDVLAARAAGMQVVAAAYGYLAPGDDPHTWQADGVIHAPAQLLAWIGP